MAFPTQVNVQQAPAVAGDFASHNPRATVDNLQGGFVAGAAGATVAAFAWADPTNIYLNSYGSGAPTGFIAREVQGTFNAVNGVNGGFAILPGFPVTAFSFGDFFVKNTGTSASVVGQKAYANNSTGAVSFGATGSPTGTATITGANQTIVANTFAATTANNSFTGSISGTTMTLTAVTGIAYPGQILSGGSSGTGFIGTNTTIVAQLTGTTGSTGTYQVSQSQTVTSTTISATGSCLTITGRTSGALYPGQVVSGTGIPTGTTIVGYGTMASATATSGTVALSAANTSTGSGVTITGVGGYLVATSGVSGTSYVGDAVVDTSTAANMPSGTTIAYIFSQSATALTAMLSISGSTASSTDNLTVNANTETKWYAISVGQPGELVIMSSYALG